MDHFCIGDRDIQEITREGIRYPGGFIDFADCAARFYQENGGSGTCVGECFPLGRRPYLSFHTQTLKTHVVFPSDSRIREVLRKAVPALLRLQEMKSKLSEFGYTTFDLG